MDDTWTTREIALDNSEQIRQLRGELEEVKAQQRLFAIQLGWDPEALEFPR